MSVIKGAEAKLLVDEFDFSGSTSSFDVVNNVTEEASTTLGATAVTISTDFAQHEDHAKRLCERRGRRKGQSRRSCATALGSVASMLRPARHERYGIAPLSCWVTLSGPTCRFRYPSQG